MLLSEMKKRGKTDWLYLPPANTGSYSGGGRCLAEDTLIVLLYNGRSKEKRFCRICGSFSREMSKTRAFLVRTAEGRVSLGKKHSIIS